MMDAIAHDQVAVENGAKIVEVRMVSSTLVVTGAIIDSWVEPSGSSADEASRLILQIAPLGHPRDLMIVEAAASLAPDRGWIEDLSENLCHGSPVAAIGHLTMPGQLAATQIRLDR